MASRLLSSRLRILPVSAFLRSTPQPVPQPPPPSRFLSHHFLSTTVRRVPSSRPSVDIGARERQLQNCLLWTYALTFDIRARFVVIVLATFQDQLIFYLTPTDALAGFQSDPSRNRLRLGGLLVEGSVGHPSTSSPAMEFVVTDLVTDILVKHERLEPAELALGVCAGLLGRPPELAPLLQLGCKPPGTLLLLLLLGANAGDGIWMKRRRRKGRGGSGGVLVGVLVGGGVLVGIGVSHGEERARAVLCFAGRRRGEADSSD